MANNSITNRPQTNSRGGGAGSPPMANRLLVMRFSRSCGGGSGSGNPYPKSLFYFILI